MGDRSLVVNAGPFDDKGGHGVVPAPPEMDAVVKCPDLGALRLSPLRAFPETVQLTKTDGVKEGTGVQVRTVLDAFQETVLV